jgi:uncharacterized protein (DUF1330 family)
MLAKALLLLLLIALGAMLWQHLRYLDARRTAVQDRQPLLYGASTFHVATFLRMVPGADVIEEVRKLYAATQSVVGVRWIYAGKVVLTGNPSKQIGPVDWDASVVLQYPSREAYEQASASENYRLALAQFAQSYSYGFERSPVLNLMLPQIFLARRVGQLLKREPSSFPFERKQDLENERQLAEGARRLLAERELGAKAAVVVNLQKQGTTAQQASDRGYVSRMTAAMAEGGYGPMHIGQAVRLEGDAEFDTVAIVYYPGVEFFADMLRSEFFQGIISGKQLGDTQATITVPILDLL